MKDYSNYHNINTKAKIVSDGRKILLHALENGFESEEVLIDSVPTKAIFQSKYSDKDGDSRNILAESGTIHRGSLVTKTDGIWLVTGLPTDNGIYEKAILEMCNAEITISLQAVKTLIGHDSKGRPIYEYIDQLINLPAIVEKTNVVESMNESINVDEDRVKITMPYRDLDTVNYFTVYNEKYTVMSRDKTKSIDGVGLLILIGERSTG